MALDMHTWLVDDVLTKMDKMSMAASVEARVPFLDHRLVEFVAGVPLAIKMAKGPKTLLRRAMAPVLPRRTIRRRKQAFQIPLDQWLAGPLAGFVRDVLLDQRARQRGWFDAAGVERLLGAASAAGQPSRGSQPRVDGQSIWTLLCLELWAREFLD
jgi:asparagine synthase (glutamine-hydrolysing)